MSKRTVRLAYALLGLMTLASFGGPFLIGMILRGGANPEWPPDRPVEWVAFAGIAGLVVIILVALSVIGISNVRELTAAMQASKRAREPRSSGDEA